MLSRACNRLRTTAATRLASALRRDGPWAASSSAARSRSTSTSASISFEGEYPSWDLTKFSPLEVKAGTMVLLHGENVHYSAPNTSDASRHAYSVHFVDGDATWDPRNWLQQAGDFPFAALDDE